MEVKLRLCGAGCPTWALEGLRLDSGWIAAAEQNRAHGDVSEKFWWLAMLIWNRIFLS